MSDCLLFVTTFISKEVNLIFLGGLYSQYHSSCHQMSQEVRIYSELEQEYNFCPTRRTGENLFNGHLTFLDTIA